jgi:4-amino-4-deoxy-L-arabinose transferase-like glycosyltransferase
MDQPLFVSKTPESGRLSLAVVVAVGCLAVLLRLYYVMHVVVFQPAYLPGAHGDPAQYYNYAWNLVKHGLYSVQPPSTPTPVSDSFRDPGYAWLLAAWMRVFPDWDRWYAAVLFTQAVISGLTVLCWISLGRRWLTWPWLAFAGVLMAFWPHSVAMSATLMSETLYAFLLAAALWMFDRLPREAGAGRALACGVLFAAAVLTNSVLLPFAVLVPVFARYCGRIPSRTAVVVIATTLLALLPWWIRNASLPKDALSPNTRIAMNLVQGSWPIYHAATRASEYLHDPNADRTVNAINYEIAAVQQRPSEGLALIAARMKTHPAYYVGWYLRKPAYLWGWAIQNGAGDIYMCVTYHSPYDENPIWRLIAALCATLNTAFFFLALAACVIAWRWRFSQASAGYVALLFVLVTAVHTVLQAEPRYAIPYRGAELLLAVTTLATLFGWINRYRYARATGKSHA